MRRVSGTSKDAKVAPLVLVTASLVFVFPGVSGAASGKKECRQPTPVASLDQLRSTLVTEQPGGTIRVLAGVYEVTETIEIARDDITIEGEGERTLFVLAASANEPVFVVGEPTPITPSTSHRNITLRRFRVEGNRRLQTQENSDTPGRGFLRNNCVTVRQAESVLLEDLRLEGCASGGVVLEQECSEVVLRRVEAHDNRFDGVAWDGNIHDSRIEDCTLRNNAGAGLSFDIGPHANDVRRCLIRDNAKVGMFISDADDNSFTQNVLECNGEDGVFIADTSDPARETDSRNNEFRDNVYLDNARNGIWQAGSNSTGNRVAGGLLRGKGGETIKESFPNEAPLVVEPPLIFDPAPPRGCNLQTPMQPQSLPLTLRGIAVEPG